MASAIWDRVPLTFTWNVRRLRKHSTQLITMGAMPYLLSLFISLHETQMLLVFAIYGSFLHF